VNATSCEGTASSATRNFVIDKGSSVISMSIAQNAILDGLTPVIFTVADASATTVTSKVDGSPFVSGGVISAQGYRSITITSIIITALDALSRSPHGSSRRRPMR
jgi:hypothetical protein